MHYEPTVLAHLAAISLYAEGTDPYDAIEEVAPLFDVPPTLRPELWTALRGHALRPACFLAVRTAIAKARAEGAPEISFRTYCALNAASGWNVFTQRPTFPGWATPEPPSAVSAPLAL